MITYNHEPYLGQAIDSVVAQQTSFPYELVIGEDSSTDRTLQIALAYQRARPEVVRVLPTVERLGPSKNFERTLAACHGKYLALLEGDDYWTSTHKLQKQVDFLEQHPEYSICFHRVVSYYQHEQRFGGEWGGDIKETSSFEDLLKRHFIHTSSAMVRRATVPCLPAWMHDLHQGDWPFFVLHAKHGPIFLLNETMGVYRVTGRGIWSGLQKRQKLEAMLKARHYVDTALEFRYRHILRPNIMRLECALACEYLRSGKLLDAKLHARQCLFLPPVHKFWKLRLKLCLRLLSALAHGLKNAGGSESRGRPPCQE
jgi:glycosyltransferase involved in cell wall biosynthesis